MTLIPNHAELTIQEAADQLNVSRPYVIKEIEEGRLPYRNVGTLRRILISDLIKYKLKIDSKRREAANALAAQSQELGLEDI